MPVLIATLTHLNAQPSSKIYTVSPSLVLRPVGTALQWLLSLYIFWESHSKVSVQWFDFLVITVLQLDFTFAFTATGLNRSGLLHSLSFYFSLCTRYDTQCCARNLLRPPDMNVWSEMPAWWVERSSSGACQYCTWVTPRHSGFPGIFFLKLDNNH